MYTAHCSTGEGKVVSVTYPNWKLLHSLGNLVWSGNLGTVKWCFVAEWGSQAFCFRRKFSSPPNHRKLWVLTVTSRYDHHSFGVVFRLPVPILATIAHDCGVDADAGWFLQRSVSCDVYGETLLNSSTDRKVAVFSLKLLSNLWIFSVQ